jgi:hypothetical protein
VFACRQINFSLHQCRFRDSKPFGTKLSIGETTVKNHISNILSKLGANDRAHAFTIALSAICIACANQMKHINFARAQLIVGSVVGQFRRNFGRYSLASGMNRADCLHGLLPQDVAEELRNVPATTYSHPDYFFWSGRSKRKSEVSNWIKIFAKVVATATEKHPKLFTDADGEPKPAHLHMLRDTFAVEYLLASMPLEEVPRLLGHSSVLITQKHYAPWVLERQQKLATSVRSAWSAMGVAPAK